MSLTRAIYYSELKPGAVLDLRQLLATCQRNNEANGITGFLYFSGAFFLQVLEGQRTNVSDLYHRIAADQRHGGVMLIEFVEASEREFPAWFMGLEEGADDWINDLFTRHFGSPKFEPESANPEVTLEVMQHLALHVLNRMAD